MGRIRGEEVKDSDRLRKVCRRIARDTSASEYSWDNKGDRKTEFSGIGNNVQ